jgi:hypothetical protein
MASAKLHGRLAEAGCSASEIMAISDHKSIAEVQRLTGRAGAMARAAYAKARKAFGTETETSSGKP